MTFLYQFIWTGRLFGTQTLQSSDQIVGIPWWVWIAILLVLLFLIIAGLLDQRDREYVYPATQQNSPEEAYDQVSSGTELESAMNAGTSDRESKTN